MQCGRFISLGLQSLLNFRNNILQQARATFFLFILVPWFPFRTRAIAHFRQQTECQGADKLLLTVTASPTCCVRQHFGTWQASFPQQLRFYNVSPFLLGLRRHQLGVNTKSLSWRPLDVIKSNLLLRERLIPQQTRSRCCYVNGCKLQQCCAARCYEGTVLLPDTEKTDRNNKRLPRPVIYYTVIFKFLPSHIPFNFPHFPPLFLPEYPVISYRFVSTYFASSNCIIVIISLIIYLCPRGGAA